MLKLLKFVLPPLFAGLGIAFLVVFFSPNMRTALLPNVPLPSAMTTSHLSFSDAVKRAAPSVVTIFSESISKEPRYKRQNTVQELGSGVIMSPDGYILTNYHVINNADQILVILTDGRRFFDVQLIGFDTITDLALLKINANHLPVIPVNDNYTTNVGDLVLAIGNPLNLGQTITQGIISATGKQKITDSPYNNLLQMDAAINVGNSGGALVNSNGDLVGITSAQFKTRENLNIQGIFFAVPYTLAKEVMGKLIRHGRVVRGYLGFEGTAVDSTGKEVNDSLTPVAGMRITNLDPLGPAWQAGIEEQDIVIKIAGLSVANPQNVLKKIGSTEPGKEIEFELYRNGKIQKIMVKVAELETKL
ncbi:MULTISPECIES: trypsin-like peptidase domain-containing protein [unclassified Pseudoalteromonas]|uniref:trypsin-like peptidase domain-containing protein n=1 Tax=unclassified Pseudoalteromonas TaxID=194690 RepID=UPI000948CD61|nr:MULTISPECIES: trypsin-like peptidase domain-containing protein [unclassified Pseudoalteromonas]OLF73740.1 serine protease [Pseudoalteromonas haloplanktis]PWS54373.1 PDZ domain-containing protein [Pseudoalteromonas sp. meg-B1]TMP67698.1 PDZ domain-containing protein [Pseudoalteromonas sp. S1609]TMP74333.1 PDZ domain-containing protein [Pseudoalteromonas sp. S1608]